MSVCFLSSGIFEIIQILVCLGLIEFSADVDIHRASVFALLSPMVIAILPHMAPEAILSSCCTSCTVNPNRSTTSPSVAAFTLLDIISSSLRTYMVAGYIDTLYVLSIDLVAGFDGKNNGIK